MNDEMPYNNENFYQLDGDQRMAFNFMNTHPPKDGQQEQRAQSAHLRMMNEANGNHNVARRSQIQQDLRRSSEDGSYILNQESNGKSAIRGLKYHYT